MGLLLKNYPDPRDPANPLPTAYAWISFLSIDLRTGSGQVVYDVHPSEEAWEGRPVDQIVVAVSPADMAALKEDPEFQSAFNAIGSKLYGRTAGSVPAFAGATQVGS